MSGTPKDGDRPVMSWEKERSKARPAVEWFDRKFQGLSQTQWQEYTCKACGAEFKGNSLDIQMQLMLEMHVTRHETMGDALP